MSLNRNILDEIYTTVKPKMVKKITKKKTPDRTKEGVATKKNVLSTRKLTQF